MREVYTVTFKSEIIEYNIKSKSVLYEDKSANIADLGLKSLKKTFFWNEPVSECSEGGNLKEIAKRATVVYGPMNNQLNEMLLYRSDNGRQTYGFKILEQIEICKKILYQTQSDSIFLNILEEDDDSEFWYIDNLETLKSKDVADSDILNAYIGYNEISVFEKFSSAIKDISKRQCEIERENIKANIGVSQLSVEIGILTLFGEGYHGVIRGQVIIYFIVELIYIILFIIHLSLLKF